VYDAAFDIRLRALIFNVSQQWRDGLPKSGTMRGAVLSIF
jgi:hypothetical protein